MMPGIPITDADRRKIDRKFICTICSLLLNMPMQTHCGHLMCFSCLQALFKSPNPKCPEDNTKVKEEQAFPDVFTERELHGLHLHCTNMECHWSGTYEDKEDHSQVCEHALKKCVHAQCKVKFKRSQLAEHLKNECEYRYVKCEHCRKGIPFASIKEHVETNCEGAPVICKYCKKDVLRKDLEKHEKEICSEVPATCEFQAVGYSRAGEHRSTRESAPVTCRYCKENVSREDREQHEKYDCGEAPGACDFKKIGCNKVFSRKEFQHINGESTSHLWLLLQLVLGLVLVSQQSHNVSLHEFTGTTQISRDNMDIRENQRYFTREIRHLHERNMELEQALRDKTLIIDRLQSRLDQINESLTLNTVKIVDLESRRGPRFQQVIRSYYGTLLWKIESYQRKRQAAVDGEVTSLFSPPFYSRPFGYKMCAKIYMNGDGCGKGSHLSLFFVLMRGDYDALQTWPFQKKITMMLLDQGDGDHMVETFHSDSQSSSFRRPTSDMNIASGSPLFIPLDSLDDCQYVKDDVMFIKIIID